MLLHYDKGVSTTLSFFVVCLLDHAQDEEAACGERQHCADAYVGDKGSSRKRMAKRRKNKKSRSFFRIDSDTRSLECDIYFMTFGAEIYSTIFDTCRHPSQRRMLLLIRQPSLRTNFYY
jgi:hypothetical protein